jgi:hypothetical protein
LDWRSFLTRAGLTALAADLRGSGKREVPRLGLVERVSGADESPDTSSKTPRSFRVIELDAEHRGRDARGQHGTEYRALGAFDIHLQQVDVVVPKTAHDCVEGLDGRLEELFRSQRVRCGDRAEARCCRQVEANVVDAVP